METMEDIGYVESDPETNKKIREQLEEISLDGSDEIIEKTTEEDDRPYEEIPDEILRFARGTLNSEWLTEGSPGIGGLRYVFKELKRKGLPIKGYSRLRGREVFRFYNNILHDIDREIRIRKAS